MNLLHQKQQLGRWLAQALFVLTVLVSFASCKEQEDPFRNRCVATEDQKMIQKEIDIKLIKKYFRVNDIDTTNMQVTASGIHYFKIKETSGEEIKTGDRVSVHYIGKYINKPTFEASTAFDNSYPGGTPFTVCVDILGDPRCSVIVGWSESLKLMRIGEISRFYIPSYIAYGICGSQTGSILPNEILSFEIEALRKF